MLNMQLLHHYHTAEFWVSVGLAVSIDDIRRWSVLSVLLRLEEPVCPGASFRLEDGLKKERKREEGGEVLKEEEEEGDVRSRSDSSYDSLGETD